MHWMNPYGAWALSALAIIILLYLLKQRMEPLEVSSTYLWQKTAASLEADRPLQKLRRSLLMWLQLLLALLLALSIMRPLTPGTLTSELVFVFDLSASMQAVDEQGSGRMDKAVRDALRRIDGAPDGTRISVLAAGVEVSQPLSRTTDLALARRTIDALAAENGTADLPGALSLAFALQRELEDVSLICYSDQALPQGRYAQPSIGGGLANRALLSLSATSDAAVARVANLGPAAEITVECYADGSLVDLRSVEAGEGETVSIRFDLPAPAQQVEARITGSDALSMDDQRTWTVQADLSSSVVLAGRDNIFLEKALALRPDIQLRKTTAAEAAQIDGAALTILDGPGALPEAGAVFWIEPDEGVGALQESPASLRAASGELAQEISAYLSMEAIQIARWTPVLQGVPLWLADGQPVLTAAQEDGRTIVRLGFDLHASNLPMLKEFPLFMQNLLAYLLAEPLGADISDAACGDAISITPQARAVSATLKTPSGRLIELAPTGGVFDDTNEIGVYTLTQTDEQAATTQLSFALYPPAAESDVRTVAAVQENDTQASGRASAYGREWTPWILLVLLAVTVIEWWVYRRGI